MGWYESSMYEVSNVKADGSMVIWLIIFCNVELVKVQNKEESFVFMAFANATHLYCWSFVYARVCHVTAFLCYIIIIITIINELLINKGSKAGM